MMKITGLSHLFKWENLHNWWLTKYFFAPLYKKAQSYRNYYYFVIIVNIINCFKNKEDYFIIINFHGHLQAACVLDQKTFRALDSFFPLVGQAHNLVTLFFLCFLIQH